MNQRTVLVAVSDVFFYTKIRDALLPHGYRLERVRTPDEILAKAADLHPIAVILDMGDTKLDPIGTLERIRGQDPSKTIPVLAFASHEDVGAWQRARHLGVTKIVSRNEFSARMRELIETFARGNGQAATG